MHETRRRTQTNSITNLKLINVNKTYFDLPSSENYNKKKNKTKNCETTYHILKKKVKVGIYAGLNNK